MRACVGSYTQVQAGISARQVGNALENGMSINVLYRIRPRALYVAGLLKRKPYGARKAQLFDQHVEDVALPDALFQ